MTGLGAQQHITLIDEIDLMNDTYTLRGIARSSLLILVVFTLLAPFFAWLFYVIAKAYGVERVIDFPLIFMSLMGALLCIPMHEILHGLAFKLMSPSTKVKFGYSGLGLFFASAVGARFTRKQYIIICLIPFVVITLVFALVIGFIFKAPLTAYLCIAMHTAGCAGDFFYVRSITKNKAIAYCEDTKTGVKFYGFKA